MIRTHSVAWILGGVLVFLLAGLSLGVWHAGREAALRERYATLQQVQERDRARDRADREVSALEEFRVQASRLHEELVMAAGGELAAALCDPEVTLSRAVELIAQHCLPTNATVQVRVDRFIEFEVTGFLTAEVPQMELARAARCLLTEAAGLVHSLRFAFQGQLVSGLDRQSIESVTNWATLTDDQVILLMAGPDSASENRLVPRTALAEEEEQDRDSDAGRMREVLLGFDSTQSEQIKLFSAKSLELLQLSGLAGLNTVADLHGRIERGRILQAEIAELKANFIDPFPSLTRLLLNANLDAVLVRATVRDIRERTRASRSAAEPVFSRLREFSVQLDAHLATLGDIWGRWELESDGATIRFADAATHQTFERSRKPLERSAESVQSAVSAWSQINSSGRSE